MRLCCARLCPASPPALTRQSSTCRLSRTHCCLLPLLLPLRQVLWQAPRLSALLAAPVASSSPEALFLALRLWHNLPPQQLQRCDLLPALRAGQAPPPALFWQQPGAVRRKAVAAAAAALFTAAHVQQLVPPLLLTSASHPRLHPVWGCLLALLVPGFTPLRVRCVQLLASSLACMTCRRCCMRMPAEPPAPQLVAGLTSRAALRLAHTSAGVP